MTFEQTMHTIESLIAHRDISCNVDVLLEALQADYDRLLQENTMLKEENEKLNDMLDELECNA